MAEKRVLGQSSIAVSPVGLGCMGFSHAYGEPTEKGRAVEIARIDALLDTMEMPVYGQGRR